MALVVNDRVKETSTTTGTGTFDLAGAVSGFESFVAGIGNSNTTYYSIVNENGEFEVGLGTITDAATDTLSRDTIISSSNSDSAVDFGAGTKNVFCTLPASKAVILDSSGNIVANNGSNLTNLNADNLSSGTVPDARFPATLPAANGSALTNLNASNLATGTVANARLDAELAAIGGLTSAADKGIQFTGVGTAGTFDLTTAGKALLDDADAAAQRTTLGLGSIATLNTVTLTTDTTGDYVASITAGEGITGAASGEGSTPTLAVDLDELTTSTSDADGDFFAVVDSVGAQKKLTKANINNSGFNNDSGFTTNTGTVTSVSGGNGLTGSVTTSGSLDVGAGTLIDVTADAVNVDLSELATSTSDADGDFFAVVDSANAQKKLTKGNINISGFNNDSGFTTNTGTVTSVGISPGTGLDASGTITTSGTISVTLDLSELTDMTGTMTGTDEFIVLDAGAERRKAANEIGLSIFNNDAGFTTNTGDITGVTAGSGLTGGGSSGSVTLNVGAGTGIDVAADTIAVDVSDFMTNGVNNRVLTATGTDAMNAEANLTFDGLELAVTGHVVPGANDTYDLGESGNVWRNLYTGDLHLSNEAKDEGNAVDGTKGNWTIQEGENDLYILNNKSGKKYKFKLEEM